MNAKKAIAFVNRIVSTLMDHITVFALMATYSTVMVTHVKVCTFMHGTKDTIVIKYI